jgi:hypothetical protein
MSANGAVVVRGEPVVSREKADPIDAHENEAHENEGRGVAGGAARTAVVERSTRTPRETAPPGGTPHAARREETTRPVV